MYRVCEQRGILGLFEAKFVNFFSFLFLLTLAVDTERKKLAGPSLGQSSPSCHFPPDQQCLSLISTLSLEPNRNNHVIILLEYFLLMQFLVNVGQIVEDVMPGACICLYVYFSCYLSCEFCVRLWGFLKKLWSQLELLCTYVGFWKYVSICAVCLHVYQPLLKMWFRCPWFLPLGHLFPSFCFSN